MEGEVEMEAVMMPKRDKTKAVYVEVMETKYPSYMLYETTIGKKENYNAILEDFKEMREKLFDKKTGLVFDFYCGEGKGELKEGKFQSSSVGYYLMGVIDTMAVMAQEIFEQYKAYETMFKEAVKGILSYYDEEKGIFGKYIGEESADDAESSLRIAYAILKGCSMRALLTEKYFSIAEKLFFQSKTLLEEQMTEEIKELLSMTEEQYKIVNL